MKRQAVRTHEDLKVWKLAMQMAEDTYRITDLLPARERFGMQAQIRRAAVSVVSNIAEGAARDSSADFSRFLSMSLGSLAELQTQLLLCERLAFIKRSNDVHQKIRAIRMMLASLRSALRRAGETA